MILKIYGKSGKRPFPTYLLNLTAYPIFGVRLDFRRMNTVFSLHDRKLWNPQASCISVVHPFSCGKPATLNLQLSTHVSSRPKSTPPDTQKANETQKNTRKHDSKKGIVRNTAIFGTFIRSLHLIFLQIRDQPSEISSRQRRSPEGRQTRGGVGNPNALVHTLFTLRSRSFTLFHAIFFGGGGHPRTIRIIPFIRGSFRSDLSFSLWPCSHRSPCSFRAFRGSIVSRSTLKPSTRASSFLR